MTTPFDRDKWDRRFLKIAREGATWSKDPSTQVGAVIVDPDQRVVSLGYNGPPVACSWRYGWEYRDGLCAVARGEAGDNPITEPPSEVAPC